MTRMDANGWMRTAAPQARNAAPAAPYAARMVEPTLAHATTLAQVRIPPDLIGPLIFAVIFLSSWVWNAYKRGAQRRRQAMAREAAGIREADPRDAMEFNRSASVGPGRSSSSAPARAGGNLRPTARPVGPQRPSPAQTGAGMSMRERIERARAEAAADGRSGGSNRSSASSQQPQPFRPRPMPQPDPRRAAAPIPPAPPTRELPRVNAASLSTPAPAVNPVRTYGRMASASSLLPELDAASMRKAIVTMEVLMPPVALRKADSR